MMERLRALDNFRCSKGFLHVGGVERTPDGSLSLQGFVA
jgi:hypothetical protein